MRAVWHKTPILGVDIKMSISYCFDGFINLMIFSPVTSKLRMEDIGLETLSNPLTANVSLVTDINDLHQMLLCALSGTRNSPTEEFSYAITHVMSILQQRRPKFNEEVLYHEYYPCTTPAHKLVKACVEIIALLRQNPRSSIQKLSESLQKARIIVATSDTNAQNKIFEAIFAVVLTITHNATPSKDTALSSAFWIDKQGAHFPAYRSVPWETVSRPIDEMFGSLGETLNFTPWDGSG